MLRQALLLAVVLSVGVGGGLGVGYAGLNPQVNELIAELAVFEQLEERNRLVAGEIEALRTQNAELEAEVVVLNELANEIESLKADKANLELEISKVQQEFGGIADQLKELESLRDEINSLKAPDVRLIGELNSVRIDDGGEERYTLSGAIANFGSEARDVQITITWFQEGVCACDQIVGHVEVITLSLPGRSVIEIEEVYSFSLSAFLYIVTSIN